MPTRTTNTLSDATLARFNAAAKRVLGTAPTTGTDTPFGDGDGDDNGLWIKITSNTTATANVFRYTVDVFRNPWGSASAVKGGCKARNANEVGGTATNAGGYALDPSASDATCGVEKSLVPIADGTWHKVLGRYYDKDADERFFAFNAKNDTVMTGTFS